MPTKQDAAFMRAAIASGLEGVRKGNGPFGAAIARNGKLVAAAHNTVLQDKDPTCHAEINAIRLACKKLGTHDLSGCIIYSTAEPCPMCFTAIHWARISKLFYGCTRKDTAKIGFDDRHFYDLLEHKAKDEVPAFPFFRKQCIKLFQEWAKNPARKTF